MVCESCVFVSGNNGILMTWRVETLLRRQWMQWLVSLGSERWCFPERRSLLDTFQCLLCVDTVKERYCSLLKFENEKENNSKQYEDEDDHS
jgi:hypothetical protein